MAAIVLAVAINKLWHVLPLTVVVSLVYCATRHEEPLEILSHAARTGIWVLAFLAVLLGILTMVSHAV